MRCSSWHATGVRYVSHPCWAAGPQLFKCARDGPGPNKCHGRHTKVHTWMMTEYMHVIDLHGRVPHCLTKHAVSSNESKLSDSRAWMLPGRMSLTRCSPAPALSVTSQNCQMFATGQMETGAPLPTASHALPMLHASPKLGLHVSDIGLVQKVKLRQNDWE